MIAVLVDGVGNWIVYQPRQETVQRINIPGAATFVRTEEVFEIIDDRDPATPGVYRAPVFRQEGTGSPALRQQRRLTVNREDAA